MNRIQKYGVMAVAAAALTGGFAGSMPAHAQPAAPAAPTGLAAVLKAAPDGKFYAAYSSAWLVYCGWSGGDWNWKVTSDADRPCGNINNGAQVIFNNGYSGNKPRVKVYDRRRYYNGNTMSNRWIRKGGSRCILRGEWLDLSKVEPGGSGKLPTFTHGASRGKKLRWNISSHEWVNKC